jgi:hypothetical protein
VVERIVAAAEFHRADGWKNKTPAHWPGLRLSLASYAIRMSLQPSANLLVMPKRSIRLWP